MIYEFLAATEEDGIVHVYKVKVDAGSKSEAKRKAKADPTLVKFTIVDIPKDLKGKIKGNL